MPDVILEIPVSVEESDKLHMAILNARQAEKDFAEAQEKFQSQMQVAQIIWEQICIKYQQQSGKGFVIPKLFTSQGIVVQLVSTARINLGAPNVAPEIKRIPIKQEAKNGESINGVADNQAPQDGK